MISTKITTLDVGSSHSCCPSFTGFSSTGDVSTSEQGQEKHLFIATDGRPLLERLSGAWNLS